MCIERPRDGGAKIPLMLGIALVVGLLSIGGQLTSRGNAAPAQALAGGCPIRNYQPPAPRGARVNIPLTVSLEWDSRGSLACQQWQAALDRAADTLQSATGGQATIGPVTIADNAAGWATADVQVHVSNTGVPNATVGGIPAASLAANGATADPGPMAVAATFSDGGVFAHGSIHLGRSWSEFGPRRGRWSDPDGFRTLVHELAHYAFFLYDEYFGYVDTPSGAVRVPAACATRLFDPADPGAAALAPGGVPSAASSLMYWEYTTSGFWGGPATPECAATRQWQVYHANDWRVIHHHYPSLAQVPATSLPAVAHCAACEQPAAARWLLDLLAAGATSCKRGNTICLSADGYLVKAGGKAVLHEGIPYLRVPSDRYLLPTAGLDLLSQPAFYPAGKLEILGGNEGDLARITLADAAGRVLQATQRLTGPAGAVTPNIALPAWFNPAQSVVPLIAVQPLVGSSGGHPAISGLRVIASNPLPAQSMAITGQRGSINARLFEAGQGRQVAGSLLLAGTTGMGGERYAGILALAPRRPILEGSLYLAAHTAGGSVEDAAKAAGGAWAIASYSLSCNSPSFFLEEFAPGDEGGIDSADGVVNVRLISGSQGLKGLCISFTRQVAAPPAGAVALSEAYAIQGSVPLPATAAITIHVDRDALLAAGGSAPFVLRAPLPTLKTGGAAPCVAASGPRGDLASGTLTATAGDGIYQAVLLPPALAARLQSCQPGTPRVPTAIPTATSAATATATPTDSTTPTATTTATQTSTATITGTATATPSPTQTILPAITPTATSTPSPTAIPLQVAIVRDGPDPVIYGKYCFGAQTMFTVQAQVTSSAPIINVSLQYRYVNAAGVPSAASTIALDPVTSFTAAAPPGLYTATLNVGKEAPQFLGNSDGTVQFQASAVDANQQNGNSTHGGAQVQHANCPG